MTLAPCAIVGCERPASTSYVCDACTERWGVGDSRIPSAETMLEFLRHCCLPVGECWEPQFPTDGRGYTQIEYFGKRWKVHRLIPRLVCDIECGEDQNWKRAIVLHSAECEFQYRTGLMRARCINPDHLRLGTRSENEDDKRIVDRMIDCENQL